MNNAPDRLSLRPGIPTSQPTNPGFEMRSCTKTTWAKVLARAHKELGGGGEILAFYGSFGKQ